MIGRRLRKANHIAKKRFKRFIRFWDIKKPDDHLHRIGMYRKGNVFCSCQACRNPRHSIFENNETKLTIQERKDKENTEEQLISRFIEEHR